MAGGHRIRVVNGRARVPVGTPKAQGRADSIERMTLSDWTEGVVWSSFSFLRRKEFEKKEQVVAPPGDATEGTSSP